MLLLLILELWTLFWLADTLNALSMANQLLVMVQEVYQGIRLTVLFQTVLFLKNFMFADELLTKALWRFWTCLSINNNLGKLVSSSLKIFDDNLWVTWVAFFVGNFNTFSTSVPLLYPLKIEVEQWLKMG